MDITPGVGIGTVRFGMLESEVINILGIPDEIEELEYIEGNNDWYRELYYFAQDLALSFEKADDFKLGNISISAKGHRLFGQDVFLLNPKQVEELIASVTSEEPLYEDCTWGNPNTEELLTLDGHGIKFLFNSGSLSEVIFGCFVESDNETLIWP